MMPKVSVVIASYNHEAFIGSTLASLEQQTFQDFEIILIDDGSADKTVEVAKNVKSRAQIIQQKNQGVVAARNRGVELAKGEYICFVDSDDMVLPDRFKKQVTLLDSDPAVGITFADALIIDEQGRKVGRFSDIYPVISGDTAEMLLLHYCFVPMITVMLRTDVLRKTGPFEKPGPISDYIKWIEIAYHSKAAYLPEPLGCWRRHAASTSKVVDKSAFYAEMRVAIHRILRRYPELRARVATRINRRFSRSYFLAGFFFAAAGKVHQARKNYRKAVKLYPWSAINWAAVAFSHLPSKRLVSRIHHIIRAKKLPW